MNDNYGVTRDIFAKVKLGGFFIANIAFVGGAGFLGSMYAQKIFPATQFIQMILFIILTILIAVYLVFPFNGGKQNWHSLLIFLKRRKKFWISFDWDKFINHENGKRGRM